METNQQETIGSIQNKQCKHCKMEIPKDAKVCPHCRKKQGGKGKWIIIGVVVVLILLGAAGGDSGKSESPDITETVNAESTGTETVPEAVSDSAPEQEAEPEPTQSPEPTRYKSGMYLVGTDMPAGEYKIVVDEDAAMGLGYLEVASDSSHDFASLRTNDNIESSAYISVNEGEYLTLNECHIEP